MTHNPFTHALCSSSAFLLACVLAGTGIAQDNAAPRPDPLASAQKRLQTALQKCSALEHSRFETTWSDPVQRPNNAAPRAVNGPPPPAAEAPTPPSPGGKGSWHGDLLHVILNGPMEDEILRSGNRMIARQKEHGWKARHDRYADGQMLDFLPDPKRLLETLQQLNLKVQHRETGLLDDRPVEFLALQPEPADIAELLWQGLLPGSLATQQSANLVVMLRALGQAGGDRAPAAMPSLTLDIAIAIDPATSTVRQVHMRGYHEGNPQQIAMAGAGFVAVRLEEKVPPADEPEQPKKQQAPGYERGLLQRPREKLVVRDYVVTFSEHGEARPPELDADAKRLLRRQ